MTAAEPMDPTEVSTAHEESAASEEADRASEFESVQTRVAGLLKALGIQVVVSIDDVHFVGGAGGPSEVGEALAGSDELRAAVVPLLSTAESAIGFEDVDEQDTPSIADYISSSWAGFAEDLRQQLLALTRTLTNDRDERVAEEQIVDDLQSQVALRGVFEGVVDFVPLSMAEWRARGRELILDGRKYLVLIDRTFTREEGGADDTGEELLGDLLTAGDANVLGGLLTRHAKDEKSEQELTAALRAKFPDHAPRIAAIGKFRTTTIALLPAGLRAMLLSSELHAYREHARKALLAAGAEAVEHFDGLSDYAIVEAFASAQTEGTFELDQPVRLAERAFGNRLATDLRDGSFSKTLDAFRTSTVGAFQNAHQDLGQIRALLRADVFEPEGHVNSLGLPLEVGDIFAFEPLDGDGQLRHYILLGQACDLSIRARGRRSPELSSVTLARVAAEAAPSDNPAKHLLGYLDSASDSHWHVDLRAGYEMVVSVDVLDATVFNSDGQSKVGVAQVETRPMAAGQLERLRILRNKARVAVNAYNAMQSQVKTGAQRDKILRALAAEVTCGVTDWREGPTVAVDVANKTITYGVKRIGRVRANVAGRVADIAARYRSRPALEADLVREPPAPSE